MTTARAEWYRLRGIRWCCRAFRRSKWYRNLLGVVRAVDVVGGMLSAGVIFDGVFDGPESGFAVVDKLRPGLSPQPDVVQFAI
jgi:hypothetical protein